MGGEIRRQFTKMSVLQTFFSPKSISSPFAPINPNPRFYPKHLPLSFSVFASSSENPNPKSKRRTRKSETPPDSGGNPDDIFPTTIPRKPRRGRRSEAVAVEDFIRNSLERTFASIRKQNSGVLDDKEEVLKEKIEEEEEEADSDGADDDGARRTEVVEEDDPNWPADAEVGWGIRASDYFEKHPIRNVVVDGVEIDWEGEMDDSWVKEINCLEWESFAFHPSPLIVLVFERYNKRAADNWKLLKELEKAIKVYWGAKDRLPPRLGVKFPSINPTALFSAVVRTADELVQMIAYFYYNAKKPLWIDDAAMAPPY